MANEAQIESWDGAGGQHWVEAAERYDRLNGPFNVHILGALDPQPGERALDVGCGNGALSLELAARVAPDGEVVGLDVSRPMLSFATTRAADAGVANIRFERGDAQVHDLGTGATAFDILVSRFGVMFFEDPIAAFTNLARFLIPGARLAFTCWREMVANEWIRVPVAAMLEHVPTPDPGPPGQPGPFAFADGSMVEAMLSSAGYVDIGLEKLDLPLVVGATLDDSMWFLHTNQIATAILAGADEATAELARASARQALEPFASDDGVRMNGSAWLVTARRS